MPEWFKIQNQKASHEKPVILFHRSGVYYSEDTDTGRQTSLRTKDKADALRLLHAKNEATHQPAMNLQIAQVYLQHGDPALSARTWQQVMDTMAETKSGNTFKRWQTAMRDRALDPIRQRKLIEATAEHFLAVLKAGTVSTNMFLRRLHNYSVNMRWIPRPSYPNPTGRSCAIRNGGPSRLRNTRKSSAANSIRPPAPMRPMTYIRAYGLSRFSAKYASSKRRGKDSRAR